MLTKLALCIYLYFNEVVLETKVSHHVYIICFVGLAAPIARKEYL
jgi:hypothetical protein